MRRASQRILPKERDWWTIVMLARMGLVGEARRARLLRRLGRIAEAEPVEARLRTLLAVADPDHPILKQLSFE